MRKIPSTFLHFTLKILHMNGGTMATPLWVMEISLLAKSLVRGFMIDSRKGRRRKF